MVLIRWSLLPPEVTTRGSGNYFKVLLYSYCYYSSFVDWGIAQIIVVRPYVHEVDAGFLVVWVSGFAVRSHSTSLRVQVALSSRLSSYMSRTPGLPS